LGMVGSSNKGKMVLPRRYLLGGGTAMLFNYTGDILRLDLARQLRSVLQD